MDYGKDENSSPDQGASDLDCLSLTAELDGNDVIAAVSVWTGDDLVAGYGPASPDDPVSMPVFAHCEVRVSGGSLSGDVMESFDLYGGVNEQTGIHLVSGLRPGD